MELYTLMNNTTAEISLEQATQTDINQWLAERGMCAVPLEPSEAMSRAGVASLQEANAWATGCYKAMIKAAQEETL